MDILISNGCSFSECHSVLAWPVWLASNLNIPTVAKEAEFWARVTAGKSAHIALGMGSQGNGQIHRRTANIIAQLIDRGTDLDRAGVVVQWSGPDRWDYYADVPPRHLEDNRDNWVENPVFWPRSDRTGGGWVIANHHWQNSTSSRYYREFHSPVWGQIQTMEHVIALQSTCGFRGIRQFSFAYTDRVFRNKEMSHPQVAALDSLVQWDKIDITGEWNWVERNLGIDEANRAEYEKIGFAHPTLEQHRAYAEQWVLPHLERAWQL